MKILEQRQWHSNYFFVTDFEQTLDELLEEFDATACYPEEYLEPCQTSKNVLQAVHDFQPLTVFVKYSILDVW